MRSTAPKLVTSASFVRKIKAAAAEVFAVKVAEIEGRSRKAAHRNARWAAMLVLFEETAPSLAWLGRAFNRDHSTVLHALRELPYRMECDPGLAAKVEEVRRRVEG